MYQFEIKGVIEEGESLGLTCCTYLQDLTIDGVSLHAKLREFFDLSEVDFFENGDAKDKSLGCKYVILDKKPELEVSFNDQSADMINDMLSSAYTSGCYSEYTCGYGDFDYILGTETQRSLFTELESHIGKYVHLVL